MDLVSVIICVIITLCPQVSAYRTLSDVCPQGSINIEANLNSKCPEKNIYTLVEGENLCLRIIKNNRIKRAWMQQSHAHSSKPLSNPTEYDPHLKEFTITFDRNVTIDFKGRWTYTIVLDTLCPTWGRHTCKYHGAKRYLSMECDVDFVIINPPLVQVHNTTLTPIASKRTEEEHRQNLYLFYKYKYRPGTKTVEFSYNNIGSDRPKTEWVVETRTGQTRDINEDFGRTHDVNLYEGDNNTFVSYIFDGNGIKIHTNITFVIEPVSDIIEMKINGEKIELRETNIYDVVNYIMKYKDGDSALKISCIKLKPTGTLEWRECKSNLTGCKFTDVSDQITYPLDSVFKKSHNNTTLDCIYKNSDSGDRITARILFVDERQPKNISKTVMGVFEKFKRVIEKYLGSRMEIYKIWDDQKKSRGVKALSLKFWPFSIEWGKKKNKKDKFNQNTSPKTTSITTTAPTLRPSTTTTPTNLYLKYADTKKFPMTINGEIKHENFIYKYEKDQDVNITCKALIQLINEDAKNRLILENFWLYICELRNRDLHRLNYFPPTGPIKSAEEYVINVTITPDETYDNKIIVCAVLRENNKTNYALKRSIEMTMIMINETETTTTMSSTSSLSDSSSLTPSPNQASNTRLPWFWYAAIGGVCVMIILIVALINMIMKRSKQTQQTSYENFTSDDSPNFPNSATLEETYCKPSDVMNNASESSYSQPYVPKDPAELYSVPIPKQDRNKSKHKKQQECLYSELTFEKKFDNDNSLYSEITSEPSKKNIKNDSNYATVQEIKQELNAKVLSKGETDEYINVFDNETYVNSKTRHGNDHPECNEPNYSEVKPWH